jgi:hypothetical protein
MWSAAKAATSATECCYNVALRLLIKQFPSILLFLVLLHRHYYYWCNLLFLVLALHLLLSTPTQCDTATEPLLLLHHYAFPCVLQTALHRWTILQYRQQEPHAAATGALTAHTLLTTLLLVM